MLFIIGLLLLLFVAPPLLVVWLLLHFAQRKETAQYRAMVETPTTPIAQVGAGGFVALQGRALASDQGTVTSPIGQRPVLSCTIDIKEAHRKVSSHGIEWRTVHEVRERREFWLDDGSGKRAWISPEGAGAIMMQTRYGGTTATVIGGPPETVVEMTPAVDAWARRVTGSGDRKLSVVSVEESLIEEGAPLYALGWAVEHDGVPVLRSAPGQELMLSTLTESQLRELIEARSTLRLALLLGGCASAIAGVTMMVVSLILAL